MKEKTRFDVVLSVVSLILCVINLAALLVDISNKRRKSNG